jgi:glycosyltransferase involved in cell wall biosynthesis
MNRTVNQVAPGAGTGAGVSFRELGRMTQSDISVIIPAYKAAGTIARALDSVLAQTRPAAEILVVDDGSPDDIAAALAPYAGRVALLRKPNGGAASARNWGLDRARGRLIAFLDADDYWEPHKLARQLAVLERHPRVGLVAGAYFEQAPGGERRASTLAGPVALDQEVAAAGARAFEIALQVWTSVALVRRDALGGLRFDETLRTAEDRDLWIRLIAGAPHYLIAEPLATAVMERNSLSRSAPAADFPNLLRVIHRHRALLGPGGVRRRECDTYRKWAASCLGVGEPWAALRPAWNRLVRQPLAPEAWWVLLKSASLTGLGQRAAAQP